MASGNRQHSSNSSNRYIRRLRRWFRKLTGKNEPRRRRHRSSSQPEIPDPLPFPLPEKSVRRDNSPYFTKVMRRLRRRYRKLTGKSSSRQHRSSSQIPAIAPQLQPLPESAKALARANSSFFSKIKRRFRRRFRSLTGKSSQRVHRHRSPVPFQVPSPDVPAISEKSVYSDYFPYFANSTMMFLLAYLAAWFTYQAAVMIAASLFHIDSVLFYYEVMFPIGTASKSWTVFNIIFITFCGPLISLITGFIYFVFIVRRKKASGNVLMFFNWLIIHSFCMFFAAFVAGAITWRGFGYVLSWTGMPIYMKIIISSIFLTILALVGFLGSRYILATTNSISRIRSKNRRVFMFSQTILPWFVGSLILAAIKYPMTKPQHDKLYSYDMIIIGCVLFMIVPPFFNKLARPYISAENMKHQRTQVSRWGMFILLMVLFVFRGGLAYGLHFIMNFSISISLFQ